MTKKMVLIIVVIYSMWASVPVLDELGPRKGAMTRLAKECERRDW